MLHTHAHTQTLPAAHAGTPLTGGVPTTCTDRSPTATTSASSSALPSPGEVVRPTTARSRSTLHAHTHAPRSAARACACRPCTCMPMPLHAAGSLEHQAAATTTCRRHQAARPRPRRAPRPRPSCAPRSRHARGTCAGSARAPVACCSGPVLRGSAMPDGGFVALSQSCMCTRNVNGNRPSGETVADGSLFRQSPTRARTSLLGCALRCLSVKP